MISDPAEARYNGLCRNVRHRPRNRPRSLGRELPPTRAKERGDPAHSGGEQEVRWPAVLRNTQRGQPVGTRPEPQIERKAHLRRRRLCLQQATKLFLLPSAASRRHSCQTKNRLRLLEEQPEAAQPL